MLRAFSHKNDGLALELEGQLVGGWAVQVNSLLSGHFVSNNGLLDGVSEVSYVDSVGEQLLFGCAPYRRSSWQKPAIHAKSVKGLTWILNRSLEEKETLAGMSLQRPGCFPRKSPPPPQKGPNRPWRHSENEQRVAKTCCNTEPVKP